MITAVKKMENIKRIDPCKTGKPGYNKNRTNVLYWRNQEIRKILARGTFLAGRLQWI